MKVLSGKYDDIKWAFTTNPEDHRGVLFMKYIDELGGRTELKEGDSILGIMRVENYENKPEESYGTNVHNEFTDFIVDTALFHKEIDDKNNTVKNNNKVQIFFENVYAKWNSLNDHVKDFYNKYFNLMHSDGTNWKTVE